MTKVPPPVDTPFWRLWFDALGDATGIRQRAIWVPPPDPTLHTKTPVEACERLSQLWKETYVPHEQQVHVLQQFLQRAAFAAEQRFPSNATYEDAIYSRTPMLLDAPDIWSLSGLAGVGKSSTITALTRVLTLPDQASTGLAGAAVVPRPIVHIKIGSEQSPSAVLRSLANPLFAASRKNIPMPDLLTHLREWLYVQATVLIVVDELQFLTRSASASTLIANLVCQLSQLGPPLAYVCNYSLLHKLATRPQEDKDRLLAHLIAMEAASSNEQWAEVIAACVSVAPDLFALTQASNADELHRLTGGNLRILRILLLDGCRLAWPASVGRRVNMEHLRQAYRSAQFASQRRDVEALQSLSVSARLRQRHKDLVSPLGEMVNAKSVPNTSAHLTPRSSSAPAAVQHMLESAINAGGRQVLKELRAAATHNPTEDKQPSPKVTRLAPRGKPTAQDLLQGARYLAAPQENARKSADGSPGSSPNANA